MTGEPEREDQDCGEHAPRVERDVTFRFVVGTVRSLSGGSCREYETFVDVRLAGDTTEYWDPGALVAGASIVPRDMVVLCYHPLTLRIVAIAKLEQVGDEAAQRCTGALWRSRSHVWQLSYDPDIPGRRGRRGEDPWEMGV